MINGTSASAQKWVRIFERLTRVHRLDSLTLLPLRHTLSDMLLFKRYRAWCPHCYEEDYTKGPVYERLSWTLQIVTACPRHVVRLEDHCSHCDDTLPPLAVHSRPGHCSACGEWLGRPDDTPHRRLRSDVADYELYVATAVGDLLACSGNGGRLSAARFRKNLRICIRRTASGNAMAFAEFTHMSNTAVHSWLDGITLPRLDVLVRVSARLGISVSVLLTSRGLTDIEWAVIGTRFSQHDRNVKGYRTSAEIRAYLVAALRDEDCSSVPELAKRLGFKRCDRLRQVDAELCRRITRRYRAGRRTHWWKEPGAKRICELNRIHSLLEQSLVQDPPVPVRRIAAMLGYADGNGGFIHRKFPDLCRSIAIKRKAWEEQHLEALRNAVSNAILEQPPPTLHELSRRLGFQTSTTLRSWAPDCRQVQESGFGLCSRRDNRNARSVECRPPGRSRAVVCECCPEVPAFDLKPEGKSSRSMQRNCISPPAATGSRNTTASEIPGRRSVAHREGPESEGTKPDSIANRAFTARRFAQGMGICAACSQES